MPYFNTILLVDDDFVNNFITERTLRRSNIAREVKTVRNGEEALTFLTEQINRTPELIILDVNMPEMNGIDFLKNFKKMVLEKNIKVVLLTSVISPGQESSISRLGFEDIMIKPFTEEKLLKILKKDLIAR
ncbi:chemotaxis protein CheY [Sporocytophaga myxococcoides]|uniref:Chemotaxis protein CheY n=1 Tax=Sporocytophaga myxococcoides TaxID=153721 RepID=A0A098LCE4_9BACT|nr:response regulator [Sporocytophaga myxococcoides]GAL84645.1 chemotaxis protein CheY [Sporocytophaga myxococcoides]